MIIIGKHGVLHLFMPLYARGTWSESIWGGGVMNILHVSSFIASKPTPYEDYLLHLNYEMPAPE